MADTDTPPGWDYNPASWPQRLPIIGLALIGCGIATYLALYQWGVIGHVWEPFFGDGSEVILNSSVSHILSVPDAALGGSATCSTPWPAPSAAGRAGGRCPGS